jgi:hypothetical protein
MPPQDGVLVVLFAVAQVPALVDAELDDALADAQAKRWKSHRRISW